MNIFDEVNENLFSILASKNKRKYADILALIWDRCKRLTNYAIEKSTIFDMVEDYLTGLHEQIELDFEEEEEDAKLDNNIPDIRRNAYIFIRVLKNSGWLTEKDEDYEEEAKLAINYKIIPLLKSFQDIINPKIVTYKGKLFKIYSMLEHIAEYENPYENILKEASEDFDNLNQNLRILAASIEDYINNLTKGKKPEEILDLFNNYEEKVVVGSYHRFKTNDNLYYYKESLTENLDICKNSLFDKLVNDYMATERTNIEEATSKIKELINKLNSDIEEMEAIMETIDKRHALYRSRVVQRAQFLLSSDGSVKSKINNLLLYYASSINTKDDLLADDDSICNNAFQIYSQRYFDCASLQAPTKKRTPTPIDLMQEIIELDKELVEEKKRKMLEYIKNALTSENVNRFAMKILKEENSCLVSSFFEGEINTLIKIIGLHTYSQSPERRYDIKEKNEIIEYNNIRFNDFEVIKRNIKNG